MMRYCVALIMSKKDLANNPEHGTGEASFEDYAAWMERFKIEFEAVTDLGVLVVLTEEVGAAGEHRGAKYLLDVNEENYLQLLTFPSEGLNKIALAWAQAKGLV